MPTTQQINVTDLIHEGVESNIIWQNIYVQLCVIILSLTAYTEKITLCNEKLPRELIQSEFVSKAVMCLQEKEV